jgi:hypothetical protein
MIKINPAAANFGANHTAQKGNSKIPLKAAIIAMKYPAVPP